MTNKNNPEIDWVTVWSKLREELDTEEDPTIVLDKYYIFWTQHQHQIRQDFHGLWQGTLDILQVVIQQVDLAVRVYDRLSKE